MLGKFGVDRFTGPRRETYVRYKFGFKIILKALDWYYEKLGFADLPGHDGKVMPDKKMIFKSH